MKFNPNYFGNPELERKYNENRDEQGRFASGDSGSVSSSQNNSRMSMAQRREARYAQLKQNMTQQDKESIRKEHSSLSKLPKEELVSTMMQVGRVNGMNKPELMNMKVKDLATDIIDARLFPGAVEHAFSKK